MRRFLIVLGAGLAVAVTVTLLSNRASAAPANGAAARALADDRAAMVQLVQHRNRGGRFGNQVARDRYINSRLSRMTVITDSDGTILLPGIKNDRRGRTLITGAPRSRGVSGNRIGVWKGGSGGRIGAHNPGTGGRLTGKGSGKRH